MGYGLYTSYVDAALNVSTFSGVNGFEHRYDNISDEAILSWTSVEDPNTTIEIARGSVNFHSSEQIAKLDNGSLVAIWSEYNSGVFASIIDPLTADLTIIDLTASLNLSTADAWNYSIHPTDDGGFGVFYEFEGEYQDGGGAYGLYTSYVDPDKVVTIIDKDGYEKLLVDVEQVQFDDQNINVQDIYDSGATANMSRQR